jgi:competence protein ComEC
VTTRATQLADETAPTLLRRPLVVAAVAFSLGVLAADPGGRASPAIALVLLSSIALGLLARGRRVVAIALLPAPFFFAGVAATQLRAPAELSLALVAQGRSRDPLWIEGIVKDAPEMDVDRMKMVIDAVATSTALGAPYRPAFGRIEARLPRAPESNRASCASAGDRVRVRAMVREPEAALSLGMASSRARADREGLAAFAYVSSAEECAVIAPFERSGARTRMERLRQRMHAAIDRRLPREQASIVRAFATGDRAAIPRSVNEDFTAAGLSHLLAVSGLNLAIVAGLFVIGLSALFARIPLVSATIGARRVASIAAMPFVVLYTMLVGASPSAVRSSVMIMALLAANLLSRFREGWSALALAVLLMLAYDPATIGDVSFQLSFAAVASLLFLYPPLRSTLDHPQIRRRRLLQWPLEVALATAAATIGTLPLVAWHFQRMSLVGLFANIPAAPLSSLILVPLSLLGGLAGTLNDTLGGPILQIAGWAASLLAVIAHRAAEVPYGSMRTFAPNAFECALFYAAIIALAMGPRVRFPRAIALTAALIGCCEHGALYASRLLSKTLVLTVLPVGQGDGMIAELPGGAVWVIDTGPLGLGEGAPTAADRVVLPYLRQRRIHTVDRVIITHPHVDHLGGLAALSRQMAIKEIWWTGDRRESEAELFEPMRTIATRIVTATSPPEIVGGVEISVLGPIGGAGKARWVNDGSIVVRLAYGGRSILLTGDAMASEEAAMIERCKACLSADVLKAGHHGSKTSSTEEFLDAVHPSHVVISDGRLNRFGFPHRAVLDRLERRGARVWRTDLDGAIRIETDGRSLTVTPYRPRS